MLILVTGFPVVWLCTDHGQLSLSLYSAIKKIHDSCPSVTEGQRKRFDLEI